MISRPEIRVLVNGLPLLFGECLVEAFSRGALGEKSSELCDAQFERSSGELRLSACRTGEDSPRGAERFSERRVALRHADECPLRAARAALLDRKLFAGRQIRFAQICFILDRDRRVLFTRRSAQMKTFPLCWVTPGGRVDYLPEEGRFERPYDALRREVLEEVGLAIDDSAKCFCVYESVYPVEAQFGQPTSQVIVWAHYIVLQSACDELRVQLTEGEHISEVDQIAWVGFAELSDLVENSDAHDAREVESKSFVVLPSREVVERTERVRLNQLRGKYPNQIGQGIGEAHIKSFRVLRDLLLQQKL